MIKIRAISRRAKFAGTALALASLFGVQVLAGPIATAVAAPPQVNSVAVEGASATAVTVRGSINPNGSSTTYRFEYLPESAYAGNLAAGRDPFSGASLAPPGGNGFAGAGTSPVMVSQHPSGLAPLTSYRYRLVVVNGAGEVGFSVTRPFRTEAPTNAFEPLDHRGWEMVSPIDKNGGAVQRPGSIFGGGVFQAAAGGGAITFSSTDSFAGGPGAPAGSQYVASLGSGWSTANITTPLLSGSYGDDPDGVPYQVFSSDLATGLLSNGERCLGDAGGECPVANPPLPGSGAPAGYRDYYLRTSSGEFRSILTQGDLSHTTLGPEQFELRLVAATPGLDHVVLSSCAALSADATEVAAPGGCDVEDQNLYQWSGGELSLINLLPGQATGTPGAAIGAPAEAISESGSRIYFRIGKDLYLREGGATKVVDASVGGAEFETASSDGSIAYVLDGGNLYSYSAASGALTAVTSSGDVEGVLGASPDGSRVFYAEPAGVFLGEGGSTTRIAAAADAANWPPATGTARVSADGRYLVFLSDVELTDYPSAGTDELYRYGPVGSGSLTCVSCDPTGEAPNGAASIPGAVPDGSQAGAFDSYKPRVLSADGQRVFFDSADSLAPQDLNGQPDVYEWEAAGAGTCAQPEGCIQLISTGRSLEASTFLDASADGGEVFFLTSESIDPLDPGSYDIYDDRIGGGFTVPASPIPCIGDACQLLPEAPEDPTPGTLSPNAGNPPLTAGAKAPAPKKKHRKHKKHGKKHKVKKHHHKRRGAR